MSRLVRCGCWMVTRSGRVDGIGIRFRPAGLFLHRSLDGLAGQLVPLPLIGITDQKVVMGRLQAAAVPASAPITRAFEVR